MHDVYKVVKQLWITVFFPAAATITFQVRYEDWDVAYAHTTFQVLLWITVGILILIGVTGNVLMFRRRGRITPGRRRLPRRRRPLAPFLLPLDV